MAYTTLKNGSSGSDVKKLQNALISAGYSVGSSGADGIYGNATKKAVQAYQKANGLSVDGIAGNNTLSKLYGNDSSSKKSNSTAKQTINNKWSNIDLTKYEGGFKGNDATNYAESQKNAAESALKNYGKYESQYDQYLKNTLDSILNREEFSYDLNGDALYQQYKDKYMTQGKLAMMDTMGQAAAMTGGYGNSYASTAGNQAYQAHLQQLNDIVPELYQLALDKYNMEGDKLLNQYNVLSDAEGRDYSKWFDQYNMLASDRDYYSGNYFNVYDRESDTFYQNQQMDSAEYWNAYNAGYGAEQDAINRELAEREYQEKVRQYNESLAETRRANNLEHEREMAKLDAQKVAAASDTSGKTTARATENTKKFIEQVKKGQEMGPKPAGASTNNDYIKTILSNWYETGKLDVGEFNYLADYYGF